MAKSKGGRKAEKTAAAEKAAAARQARQKKPKRLLQPQHFLAVVVVFASIAASVLLSEYNPMHRSQDPSGVEVDQGPLTIEKIRARAKNAKCKDREDTERCAHYVLQVGCDAAPGWMSVMCAASCNVCHLLDPKVRCDAKRLNISRDPAYRPGEMNRMFEELQEKYPQYNVQYLKRPPDGPWVVSFDNFLNDYEIQTMIEQAGELKRSTDQGAVGEDGYQEQVVSNKRTSSNAWCQGACEQNDTVLGVPPENYEAFQLLRYNLGEEYQVHHDMSPRDNDFLAGPRVLTFFLYLSDVEEGGGTRFPLFDVTMQPKKGSAILWPSVLDSDLTQQDGRTQHQALPVIKGTKYAANQWIHLYNYKVPNIWGCTGSFA